MDTSVKISGFTENPLDEKTGNISTINNFMISHFAEKSSLKEVYVMKFYIIC